MNTTTILENQKNSDGRFPHELYDASCALQNSQTISFRRNFLHSDKSLQLSPLHQVSMLKLLDYDPIQKFDWWRGKPNEKKRIKEENYPAVKIVYKNWVEKIKGEENRPPLCNNALLRMGWSIIVSLALRDSYQTSETQKWDKYFFQTWFKIYIQAKESKIEKANFSQ